MLSVICASAKALLVFVAECELIDNSVFPCNCKTNNSNSLTRACKSSFSFFKMFISLVSSLHFLSESADNIMLLGLVA